MILQMIQDKNPRENLVSSFIPLEHTKCKKSCSAQNRLSKMIKGKTVLLKNLNKHGYNLGKEFNLCFS